MGQPDTPRGVKVHPRGLRVQRPACGTGWFAATGKPQRFLGPRRATTGLLFQPACVTVNDFDVAQGVGDSPLWPGQPMTAHWGIHDPAAVQGSDEEQHRAFQKAFRELDNRIKIFTTLRLDLLDRLSLQGQLDAIGQMPREAPLDESLK